MFAGIVLLACLCTFGLSGIVLIYLVPLACITFVVSLLIGHVLANPFRVLVNKIRCFLAGETISFQSDGHLYEADELTECFQRLSDTARVRQEDLERKESRQTQFISDVAHELRTPLTAIHGNAEMLLDPDLPPELHERFCTTIINETERLGRLAKDLLELQRMEVEKKPKDLSRVNLRDVCQGVLDTLDPLLRERQAQTNIIGEAPDVLGSRDRLTQVVSNLVANAVRFIDQGGHITLELFGLRNNAVLAVKDDGCGFGDIDPQLLFDRFYRADSSRTRETGGSGLGLAIVKSIVEAHDGSVEALNLPGGGACFIVALPAVV